MFSVTSRLVFLLFTLLHIKGITCSLTQNAGYVYSQPEIKQFRIINTPTTELSNPSQGGQQQEYGVNVQFGLPTNQIVDNFLPEVETYFADGRLLKQYSVMENNIEDQIEQSLLAQPPFLLRSLNGFISKYSRPTGNLLPIQTNIPGRSILIEPVTRNHGRVALGSGSLGYIRLPNGGIYLGSGSLGYISGQQRVSDITSARLPKGLRASPLYFGDTQPEVNPTLNNPRAQLDPSFNARLNPVPAIRFNPLRLNPVRHSATQFLPGGF